MEICSVMPHNLVKLQEVVSYSLDEDRVRRVVRRMVRDKLCIKMRAEISHHS